MKAIAKLFALSVICVLGISSCDLFSGDSLRDSFAELNQKPTAVQVADPSYLTAKAILLFETNGYTYWFYNQPLYTKWIQTGTSGAFSEGSYGHESIDGQNSYITMLRYRNDIDNYIDAYNHPELKVYSAMCGVLAVYAAIYSSDINGYIQYTEASRYPYGGPLTPEYDSVESLYKLFVEELDGYIATFNDANQSVNNNVDLIYGGNLAKWARMANTLKLKVAVRWYNNDAAKAKEIVSNVIANGAGYIDSMDDAFIFHKADASTGGDEAYQTGNSYAGWISGSSKNVIDFMKAAKDPRVRFVYTKNGFNSKVVQAFIAQGRYDDLPGFVKDNIERDAQGNFVKWVGDVEPWVRYQGVPVVKNDTPEYNAYVGEYFETSTRYNLKIGDATKSFSIVSGYQEEMIRGRVDFELPTAPGDAVIRDTDDVPWWGMYLGAGETNLYLAEFAQLGMSLPQSAEAYYKRGVELSVREWDYVAGKNKIPYYGRDYGYAPDDVSIELKDGEVEAMLATDAVKFTGTNADKLEKIYLQQLMNFSLMPNDQFVTARRSGYPKIGSSLLPFVKFAGIELTAIPRRFQVSEPSPTDIMHDIRMKAIQEQGFTVGTEQSGLGHASTTVLNTERLWQDKNAPQWGSPKN